MLAEGALPIGLTVTVLALLWVAVIALRRPYLRRMGTRHFTRRPNETMLIIAGSVLGTALITGSFITNDSLRASFTQQVYDSVGEVDEQVQLTTPAAVSRAERRIDELRADPVVDGAVLLQTASGTSRSVDDTNLTVPNTQIYSLDVAELDDFGSTAQSVGGPSLARTETIVTRDLAERLRLVPGDEVELLIYGRSRVFQVNRVADGIGFAQYRDGTNLFVAPGVLQELADAAGGRVQPTNEMWVSNRGDVTTGVDATFRAEAAVTGLLGESGVKVLTIKKTGVERAEEAADQIAQLFLVVGTFAVIAGILLLVNIFVMLAAERQSELGMLRAVGMRRADLVRSFVFEGAMYGAAAAVFGAVAGIAVGAAIITVASSIFSSDVLGTQAFSIGLTLETVSIVSGTLMGFAISFITIVFTSVRISRVNIISAIRDLNETKSRKPRLRALVAGVVAIVVGALTTSAGLSSANPFAALLGPVMISAGAYPLLARLLPKRIVSTIVAAVILAWGVALPVVIPNLLREADTPFVFVLQGLVTTFAAVVIISQNQEALSSLVRRIVRGSPRRGLAARLATTYPVARRFRTAMTLVMYALIVFTLVMITTIGYVNERNTDSFARRESSGYDVIARTNPATPLTLRDVERTNGVDGAFGIPTAVTTLKSPTESKEAFNSVYGVDEAFIGNTAYSLREWDRQYRTPDDVWRAISEDPQLVVLDRTFEPTSAGGPPSTFTVDIGETVDMTDPVSGRSVTRTVVGYSDSSIALPGSYIATSAMRSQFPTSGLSTWLVRADPSVGAQAVASALEADNVDNGVQADSFKILVGDILSINVQFIGLMRGYLALGLVIGIIGLGVIMIRAVRERRREIGILRALGFGSSTVRRAFMGEAGLVATEGIVLGIALGVVTARNLLSSSIGEGFDVPFAVPWWSIAQLSLAALVFSVLVAALPARSASKIRPAVALRMTD